MKNKKPLFIFLTFLTISLLIVTFLIYPPFRDIKSNADTIIANKDKTFFLNEQNRELENFKANYEAYKPNLEKMNQLFVDAQNPVGFITFIEGIAATSGVTATINILSATPKNDATNLPFIALQVGAKGDFSHLLTFSEKLETGPYLVKMQNMTIKKSDQVMAKEDTHVSEAGLVEAIFAINVVTQ